MRGLSTALHAAFHEPRTRIYRWVQGIVWSLIIVSIALLGVQWMVDDTSPANTWLNRADRILLTLFAIEIALRVVSYRPPSLSVFRRPPMGQVRTHMVSRIAFMLQPLNVVDVLAVLALIPELRGLRALRLLRLLRTTRVFRYHNPFAIVLQAFRESRLLFMLAFSVLVVSALLGGISIYLVELNVNPDINSFQDGLWWSLVTITTVGFGDIAPVTPLGRAVGAVLMVAGMFTLALFAGIVGSSLVSEMMSIREEQFRMSDYVNHVIVCGYDESSHLLLDALGQEMNLDETRVVLMDDHDRPAKLPPELSWVRGDPTKESELDKVRLTHASTVIVSGERDVAPQIADARTILITFTVRSYLKRHLKQVQHRRLPLYIVAEILDSENVDHARTAGADEVIETRRIGYSMIAHAVGYHGTATTMSRLLISGSHNVYIGRIPGKLPKPAAFGDVIAELDLPNRGGLAVGLRTEAGRDMINPPRTHLVEPGTLLIYLAEAPLLDPPA